MTTHDQENHHSCVISKCVPANKRPEGWKPTIGPIRRSKGMVRQEIRVRIQQKNSKTNRDLYQNSREWMHG